MIWVLILLLAGLGWLIYVFHTLSTIHNEAIAAWADIYEHLNRRCVLISQLVEVLQAGGAHEPNTFAQVAADCLADSKAFSPAEKTQTAPAVARAAHALLALGETRPNLKADERFLQLQHNLLDIDAYLPPVQERHNTFVYKLNHSLSAFPNNRLAPLFGIGTRDLFPVESSPSN